MRYDFYTHWNRWKKQPGEWLHLDAARAFHDSRRPYTVLVGTADHPLSTVHVRRDYIRVVLFGGGLREWVTCVFEARAGERVFMTTATIQTFRGQSDAFETRECHHIREDGTEVKEEEHFQTGCADSSVSTIDVSRLWAPYPAFGEYEPFFGLYWPGR